VGSVLPKTKPYVAHPDEDEAVFHPFPWQGSKTNAHFWRIMKEN
jgi:hypothetical protein